MLPRTPANRPPASLSSTPRAPTTARPHPRPTPRRPPSTHPATLAGMEGYAAAAGVVLAGVLLVTAAMVARRLI
ncbi:MAG TPA: hypothetical protein VFU25_03910, partial [Ornithinibacter sp.]|nr:hypothetical protein [Ornithinibacter sp.]